MAINSNFLWTALPNYARDADNGSTGVATSTPITNITTPEPSQHVLFSDAEQSPYHYATVLFNLGDNDNRGDDIDTFCIINHNLTAGEATFLVDIWDGTGGPPVQPGQSYETPNAIAASTNVSGAVGNIDEDPDAADALWITAVSASSNTQIRLQFTSNSTPSEIRSGDELQDFRIQVRRTASGVSNPTLAADLYDNGSFVRTLFTGQEVSSTTGQVFSGLWNFDEVSSLANTEIRLTGTTTGTATVEYGAVRWIVDTDGGGRILASSGWQTIDALDTGSLVGGADASTVGLPPTRNQVYFFSSTVTGSNKVGQCRFRDTANTSGVVKIGLVVFSKSLQTALNPDSVKPSVLPSSTEVVSLGGQTGGSRSRGRRVLDVSFPVLSSAEAALLYERIDFLKGSTIPFLICAFPTDSRWKSLLTMWVTNAAESQGVSLSTSNLMADTAGTTPADIRSWSASYRLVEKI